MTTKKSTEPATSAVIDQRADQASSELFVFGQDEEKKEFRGGRFATATDQVIKAAQDRGYRVVVKPPELFSKLAADMPLGRAFSDGKLRSACRPRCLQRTKKQISRHMS